MAYATQAWVDNTTALSAANMNNIIAGIDELKAAHPNKRSYYFVGGATAFSVANSADVVAAFDAVEVNGSASYDDCYMDGVEYIGVTIPAGYSSITFTAYVEFPEISGGSTIGTYRRINIYRYNPGYSGDGKRLVGGATLTPIVGNVTRVSCTYSGAADTGDRFHAVIRQDSNEVMSIAQYNMNLSVTLN